LGVKLTPLHLVACTGDLIEPKFIAALNIMPTLNFPVIGLELEPAPSMERKVASPRQAALRIRYAPK
jgi:hypothetical protein